MSTHRAARAARQVLAGVKHKSFINKARHGLYAGKGVGHGNKVSKAKNKTRRSWKPNARKKRFWSHTLGEMVQFNTTAAAIRTVERAGGLDNYVLRNRHAARASEAVARHKQRVILRLAGYPDRYFENLLRPLSTWVLPYDQGGTLDCEEYCATWLVYGRCWREAKHAPGSSAAAAGGPGCAAASGCPHAHEVPPVLPEGYPLHPVHDKEGPHNDPRHFMRMEIDRKGRILGDDPLEPAAAAAAEAAAEER